MTSRSTVRVVARFALLGVLVFVGGCGFIAEKDRIRIAKIDDEYITRGTLAQVIREMPDDERPDIRTRGDLIRVLNAHIDRRIKLPLGQEAREKLESTGMISRKTAEAAYFAKHQEEDYANLYSLESGAPLGLTDAELDMLKSEMDEGIDREYENILADAALAIKASEAIKAGTITVDEEDLKREYEVRKTELIKLEWMRFKAIRFPTDMPNAEVLAAEARKRVEAGLTFDAVAQEYAARNPQFVMESEIENNPELGRFRGFWVSASGAEAGAMIGPVYMPEYQMMVEAQGKTATVVMPECYMLLTVLEHTPERPLTLEEAKPRLVGPVAVTKIARKLREEHGVEIYEDKLPDPALIMGEVRRSGIEAE